MKRDEILLKLTQADTAYYRSVDAILQQVSGDIRRRRVLVWAIRRAQHLSDKLLDIIASMERLDGDWD